MSFSRVLSFQADTTGTNIITIDVDNHGIDHSVQIVGLPDKAVSESKERVMSALRNLNNNSILQDLRKITISLAPAELQKHGPSFDVAIAVGLLETIGIIKKDGVRRAYVGELALDGSIRKVKGMISIANSALKNGIEELYVPKENAKEAALISNIKIFPVSSLSNIINNFSERKSPSFTKIESIENTEYIPSTLNRNTYLSIIGQETAKRGLLIAATGGHNIGLYGPPGTGKTLLARSIIELLPPLSREQMIETTMLHSVMGMLHSDYISTPPFRSPHHSASVASIIGGGPNIRAGEIALANNGVLFMDEFPEFQSGIIEALREPLEDGRIRVARAKGTVQFKTRFILAISMNPCPCGFAGDTKKQCTCAPSRLDSYKRKLSGPIVDRLDMWIQVPRISSDELLSKNEIDLSVLEKIRNDVIKARDIAYDRQGEGRLNAHLSGSELESCAPLSPSCKSLLSQSADKLLLSARGIHRTIRLARTIADLDNSEMINERHIGEALSYRQKE
jgi:magnesium chelatase family protein